MNANSHSLEQPSAGLKTLTRSIRRAWEDGKPWPRPMIPLTLTLALGVLVGRAMPGYDGLALSVSLLAGAGCAWQLWRGTNARLGPLLLFLLLGYQLIQPWCSPPSHPQHLSRLIVPDSLSVTGTVVSEPEPRTAPGQRQRFVLEAEVCGASTDAPCLGRVLVTVGPGAEAVRAADRVRVTGRLRALRNFGNPGSFDYRAFMAWNRVWVSLYAEAQTLRRLGSEPRGGLSAAMARLRQRINCQIATSVAGDSAAVLQALSTGERDGIPDALQQAFARAGIVHLLSISGLHVGIVAAAAMGLAHLVFARMPVLLWHGAVRKASACVAILPVVAYAWLAGLSTPTVRSMLMVLTVLSALMVEREPDQPSALASAALVILALDPPALFNLSFQLTFAAVAGLLLGGRLFRRHAEGTKTPAWPMRTLCWAGELAWVSLLATLATMPLTLRAFHQVSLIAPLANLFFVPVLGSAVVIGLLSSIVLWLCGWQGALWGLRACGFVTDHCLQLTRWVADLPLAALETIIPSWPEVGLFYALLIALLMLRRSNEQASIAADLSKRRRTWASVVLAVLALLVMDAAAWAWWRLWHSDLRVTVIDVGQGSSVLLELPGGKTMLVDGGGFGELATLDTGEHIVGPLLRQRKILTLDTIVMTHPDSDHAGGLAYLAAHFKVGKLLTNGQERDSAAGLRLMDIVDERGIDCPAFVDLPRRWRSAGVEFELLWPPASGSGTVVPGRERNDTSMVLRVSHGTDRFLLPADIRGGIEAALVRRDSAALAADVLLAPHHGSRNANSAVFIEAVQPREVVCSVGYSNRHRFPHPEVLQRYSQHGARIWRTDMHGALSFHSSGRGIAVVPTRADALDSVAEADPESP